MRDLSLMSCDFDVFPNPKTTCHKLQKRTSILMNEKKKTPIVMSPRSKQYERQEGQASSKTGSSMAESDITLSDFEEAKNKQKHLRKKSVTSMESQLVLAASRQGSK